MFRCHRTALCRHASVRQLRDVHFDGDIVTKRTRGRFDLRGIQVAVGRRLVPAAFNLRRRLGLVGWRSADGPETSRGASASRRTAESRVPVVVCVWKRPHLLSRTIDCLAAQSHSAIRLCLWNNNPLLRSFVDTTAANSSGVDIEVLHSRRNAGGFGRFYFARTIVDEHPFVIFLDDDQAPAPDLVETLVQEFRPETAWSTWGYRFRGKERYTDRYPARAGQRIKYCGTRGMICDSNAFRHASVFACPKRYWFVEDLWLSYVLDGVLEWRLFKSATEIATDADEFDQYRFLGPTKDRLFRHLVRRGWDPTIGALDEPDRPDPARLEGPAPSV
jgi:glycosyl transferase family 2